MLSIFYIFFIILLVILTTNLLNVSPHSSPKSTECVLSDWLVDGPCSASCGDGYQQLKRIKISGDCSNQVMNKYLNCLLPRS